MTKATAVSRPSSGAIVTATAGRDGAFTVTNTASCGPSSAGSDVACAWAWWVPSIAWTVNPLAWMAARCGPRATTETAAAPRCRRTARWPPMAPAPKTQIFMAAFVFCGIRRQDRNGGQAVLWPKPIACPRKERSVSTGVLHEQDHPHRAWPDPVQGHRVPWVRLSARHHRAGHEPGHQGPDSGCAGADRRDAGASRHRQDKAAAGDHLGEAHQGPCADERALDPVAAEERRAGAGLRPGRDGGTGGAGGDHGDRV